MARRDPLRGLEGRRRVVVLLLLRPGARGPGRPRARPADRRLLAAGNATPGGRGHRRPALLARASGDRSLVGRLEPRAPPGIALPDRQLPLVRIAPDRPAPPLSGGAQRLP